MIMNAEKNSFYLERFCARRYKKITRGIFFPKIGRVIKTLYQLVYKLYMIFIRSFGYDICHSFMDKFTYKFTHAITCIYIYIYNIVDLWGYLTFIYL